MVSSVHISIRLLEISAELVQSSVIDELENYDSNVFVIKHVDLTIVALETSFPCEFDTCLVHLKVIVNLAYYSPMSKCSQISLYPTNLKFGSQLKSSNSEIPTYCSLPQTITVQQWIKGLSKIKLD